MKLLAHILAVASLWLAGGCSKKKSGGEDGSESSGKNNRPKVSELQPAKSSGGGSQRSSTIARQDDGLWREAGKRELFSGTVVHDLDDLRWEEKYKQGVRVSVRAWDKEGKPVPLHAWNADGSPRD